MESGILTVAKNKTKEDTAKIIINLRNSEATKQTLTT